MERNLFEVPPAYTIDADALIIMFDPESPLSRTYIGLWDRILEEMAKGRIVSHIEVLQEIRRDGAKGQELFDWAQDSKHVFKDYDWEAEGTIIKLMAPKYSGFVDGGKTSPVNADPWLIAQAKSRGLTVITQERKVLGPSPKRFKIPNVCEDPLFAVECINLVGLMKKEGWRFAK